MSDPAALPPAAPMAPVARTPFVASLRSRLSEASTWAGIGGLALVVLNLLPSALPAFHAALDQHGWARITAMAVAVLGFVVAIAKREGNERVAEIAAAASAVVEAEQRRAPVVRLANGGPALGA